MDEPCFGFTIGTISDSRSQLLRPNQTLLRQQSRFLGGRGHRPWRGRATKKRDEVAPPHPRLLPSLRDRCRKCPPGIAFLRFRRDRYGSSAENPGRLNVV